MAADASPPASSPDERLDSWKEIASYLGRTERSVRRWEVSEGLPIHRLQHDKRGSVYAFRSELDAWRASRQPSTDSPAGSSRWRLVAAATGLLAVLVAGGAVWLTARRPVAPASAVSSIAVLPFENLSRQQEQEWFSDGMTEMLITELARIRSLKVISRTSVMQYRNNRKSLKQVGQELGVDAVVEGSALLVGDRVRISAQLIQTRTDGHLWSNHYDGETKDALALQKAAAEAIAQGVGLVVGSVETRATRRERPVDARMLTPYLKGLYELHRNGFGSAVELAREAIRLDADFAPAHELLGMALIVSADFDVAKYPAIVPEARAALNRALALESDRGVALAWLGWTYLMLEHDWVQAEANMKRGFELEPATGNNYAFLLAAQGRHDEAINASQQAMLRDPASPLIVSDAAHIYHFARRYDHAVRLYRRAQELDPQFDYPRRYVVMSLYLAGRKDEAFEALTQSLDGKGVLGTAQEFRQVYAAGGWPAISRRYVEGARAARCGAPCDVVIPLVVLGRLEEALDELEQAERDLSPWMIQLEDPVFDPLRQEPRFKALLKRVGYPPAP